jgi:hypothetical protein
VAARRADAAGYPHPVRDAAEAEQAVVLMHQEPLIIDNFTVGENVWLYSDRQGHPTLGPPRPTPTVRIPGRCCTAGLGHLSR